MAHDLPFLRISFSYYDSRDMDYESFVVYLNHENPKSSSKAGMIGLRKDLYRILCDCGIFIENEGMLKQFSDGNETFIRDLKIREITNIGTYYMTCLVTLRTREEMLIVLPHVIFKKITKSYDLEDLQTYILYLISQEDLDIEMERIDNITLISFSSYAN